MDDASMLSAFSGLGSDELLQYLSSMKPEEKERLFATLGAIRAATDTSKPTNNTSTLCMFVPVKAIPEERAIPTECAARKSCFPDCRGLENKTIKTWEFEDSLFRGQKGNWKVWVTLTYNDDGRNKDVNINLPWIRGDAFLSVTVEGEWNDGEDYATYELDYNELASMDDFGGVLHSYNTYMYGGEDAPAALGVVNRCSWIDAGAKLGITPASEVE